MEKENNIQPNIIINNAKNDKFREKIKEIAPLATKIKKEESKNFQKLVKKFKNDENYEFNHLLIDKHFFFKALQEVNEILAKNNEGFLIDFSSKFHIFFGQQLMFYWKMEGYFNEDGILDKNLVLKDFYYLDQVTKQHTNDKEFIPWIEKLKTVLPIIYIERVDESLFSLVTYFIPIII